MYFVVYLKKLNKNAILPISWIKDVENHFEKFVNNSINSSQKFQCYYTTDRNAFDENGVPRIDLEPNFDMHYVENIDDEFDGCFEGKLKKFKSKFRFVTILNKVK